jgi:hypothetical protein
MLSSHISKSGKGEVIHINLQVVISVYVSGLLQILNLQP